MTAANSEGSGGRICRRLTVPASAKGGPAFGWEGKNLGHTRKCKRRDRTSFLVRARLLPLAFAKTVTALFAGAVFAVAFNCQSLAFAKPVTPSAVARVLLSH